ncbi:hypothetical protein [Streptomyces sp. NBC_00073]|uniref:hypothetical protein n=1 Tax=Streptomyces sp. NBC_00073 TaxID=2975640 RepID=UPI002F919133
MNILAEYLAENPNFGQSLDAPRDSVIVDLITEGLLIAEKEALTNRSELLRAGVYSISREAWAQRWTSLAESGEIKLKEVSAIYGWATAVEAADRIFLLPQDNVTPGGDVQLFTATGNLCGRIRISGERDGWSIHVRRIAFEANLHCADIPCDIVADCKDCEACCAECECRAVSYQGVPGLKCRCDEHGIQ